jgi:hypothetical protein
MPIPRRGNAEGVALGGRLASSSTSASWMLGFLMPADVRRSFKLPPESLV